MTERRGGSADGRALSQPGWKADLDEIDRILRKLDENSAADLRSAVQEFFLDYYPSGIDDPELDRHRRDRDLRHAWGVKEAKAARPLRMWEFRPGNKSGFRLLFGEDTVAREVVFLDVILKADGKQRQTRTMENAAKRLRRRLEGHE